VKSELRRVGLVVAAALAVASQAGAEPRAVAFGELHGAWIHPVHGYTGAGDGVVAGIRVGFFPSTSGGVAVMAGFELSCAEHFSCWKSGELGVRYMRAITRRVALVVDGLAGLETVGLHISRELYGYVGAADVGLSYRLDGFQLGLRTGLTYSLVPGYVADVGPNPSGLAASTGIAAGFQW
jgi:hypothetical protein